MKTTLLLIFLGLLWNQSAFSQSETYYTGISSNLNPNKDVKTSESKSFDISDGTWHEMIEARTIYSSSYKNSDGEIKIRYSKKPINYYNNQKVLIPILSELKATSTNSWSATNQPFPTYLNADGSFSLTLDQKDKITLGKNCKINTEKTATNFEFNGNFNTIPTEINGIDKQLLFFENAVKYNYVVNNATTFSGENLLISEEIQIPKGYSLSENSYNGRKLNTSWQGDLVVKNALGEIVATIQAPFCYDASNESILGSYMLKKNLDTYTLEMLIPTSWLNNPSRTFPIVIDPIVMGPVSTWAGGQMPSCIMPAYNKDSIQVTIPAGVTITGMYVTASFYADPFAPATMGQGAMRFSTSCATSTSFTITGPTASTAGTAYLDYYNLFNPLTCCFPESCNTSSFYLTMQLGRTGPGAGCNATYIRFDPFTTSWPFEAVIEGKTPEAYGGKWVVPNTPICSNNCTLTGRAYSYYGVAPYTYTHPWSSDIVTQGVNTGCGTGSNNYEFTLTIPNCPDYCDTLFTSLIVPPPIVTDACGTIVSGFLNETVPIITAPKLNPIYDSIVCAGDPFTIDLNSCIPSAAISWGGNGSGGNSLIHDSIQNNSGTVNTINYNAFSISNGCSSDTISVPVYIQPQPALNFTANGSTDDPILAILSLPEDFVDISQVYVGTITSWNWTFGDNTTSIDQNPTHTYDQLGTTVVCLEITNDNGCIDEICKTIEVAPADIIAPNIVTANGDGINDLLEFKYLEFYKDNSLTLLNRWGAVIYQKDNYLNDWNGSKFSEGTYFYTLTINGTDKKYTGFFQIVK